MMCERLCSRDLLQPLTGPTARPGGSPRSQASASRDFRQCNQALGKFLIIANDPVEALVLPDAPKALMLSLHLTGGERLPGMQNRFELVPGKRREARVHMIIHDDIS